MTASGNTIRVIVSGAFRAAYLELVAAFEQTSGHAVDTAFGGSMGTAPTAIPMRLKNGEVADLVILAAEALDPLIEQSLIRAGSRTTRPSLTSAPMAFTSAISATLAESGSHAPNTQPS